MTFTKGADGEIISAVVSAEYDGALIKDFLRREIKLSASLLKKVKLGGVSINGGVVTMRGIVHTGDEVTVALPNEASEHVEPIFAPLNVLYEDEHILVVKKPPNMPVHPSRGNSLTTLASVVLAYLGEPFVFRAINRLDRDTEGIVLIAKNQYAAGILSEAMKAGKFEKYYTAILSRAPSEPHGIIDAPIEREYEGSIKRIVREDGKRAVTEYRVREVLPDGKAVCDVKLHTGRTHQIRVHFAHVGAPLYADFLYGNRVLGESYSLCCSRLVFPHPITNEIIDIKG